MVAGGSLSFFPGVTFSFVRLFAIMIAGTDVPQRRAMLASVSPSATTTVDGRAGAAVGAAAGAGLPAGSATVFGAGADVVALAAGPVEAVAGFVISGVEAAGTGALAVEPW